MATETSIVAKEAAHFGALAADWWDPRGSSAMLHRINPVRLAYIRAAVDRHFGTDMTMRQPMSGRRALDVGCGAGLLCEPLARLGAETVGVDAAAENVRAATAHAAGTALQLRYHHGDIADAAFAGGLGQFDLVTAMEVIEHVADPAVFVHALAARLANNGVMILSTPNRTATSRLLLVGAAEMVGAVPKGTHDWQKFLNPEELGALAHDAGLTVVDTTGLGVDLRTRGFKLGGSKALNYLMTLVKSPMG